MAILYVCVLALVAGFPMIVDIYLAYQSRDKSRKLLIENAWVDNLGLKELKRKMKIQPFNSPEPNGFAGKCDRCI
jgi:hypothetical protein